MQEHMQTMQENLGEKLRFARSHARFANSDMRSIAAHQVMEAAPGCAILPARKGLKGKLLGPYPAVQITRVGIHRRVRFRWQTAFFVMAISGDFDRDGGSLLGGHAFGSVLILLFTAVIAFPGLHIFRLLLLPR